MPAGCCISETATLCVWPANTQLRILGTIAAMGMVVALAGTKFFIGKLSEIASVMEPGKKSERLRHAPAQWFIALFLHDVTQQVIAPKIQFIIFL